ncbi:MAG: 2-phospho-L-lactate guanylyltransferase, partial [Dehalococcoidia bacterium]
SPLLTPDERVRTAQAMLRDVLSALVKTRSLEGLVVLSRDPTAGEIAQEAGARVIKEPVEVVGESPAVDYGAGTLAREGAERVLVVPSDLPLVEAREVETLLGEDMGMPSVIMAPSDDGGTNGLLKSPPEVIPSRFGPDSLALHIHEAESRDIPYRVVRLASFTTDIDSPGDLTTFLRTPSSTRTSDLMEEMGLRQRVLI